jgi:hypothetical protein
LIEVINEWEVVMIVILIGGMLSAAALHRREGQITHTLDLK